MKRTYYARKGEWAWVVGRATTNQNGERISQVDLLFGLSEGQAENVRRNLERAYTDGVQDQIAYGGK